MRGSQEAENGTLNVKSNPSIDAIDSQPSMDKDFEHDMEKGSHHSGASDDAENDDEHHQNELQRVQTDVPPDGGYGWVCVACCFLINAHTWGLNSSYSVFLAHYLASNTFAGASRLSFAFVGGLSIGMAMLLSPVATFSVRKIGTRLTLMAGVLLETASFIGASFASQTWQLYLSQGLCFGFGMGFLFVASVGVPPQWFSKRRSLANAIAAAGSGMGGLIYSLAANAMIESISLPWAFRILGIICFAVNTTCAIVIRDRNKEIRPSQASFNYRYFANVDFLLLSAWGILSMLGYVVLIFSLANYASAIGLTQQQGSVVSAIFNLGQMVGRPPIGYFSDAMGRLNMAASMTFLSGLFTLVIWINSHSYGVLIFYAIIGGTVAGTFWATIAPVAAEVHGVKELPAVLSLTWLVITAPTVFSEPIALEIVSFNGGSYLGAQLFSGFMYIGAAVVLWVLRARRLGAVERIALAQGKNPEKVNPVLVGSEGGGEVASSEQADVEVSAFMKRIVAWRRV